MTRFQAYLKGIDKPDFARKYGFSRQLVGAWERGCMPSAIIIRKLVKETDLNFSDFFEEEDDILT